MFVAPPEKEVEWTDAGLEGSFRFLARVWRMVDQWSETSAARASPARSELDCNDAERALRRKTHDTIRRVTGDIDQRHAPEHGGVGADGARERALCVLRRQRRCAAVGRGTRSPTSASSSGSKRSPSCKEAIEALVLMLSPFAPHTSEELWERSAIPTAWRRAGWPASIRGREGRGDRRAGAGERQGARPPDRSGRTSGERVARARAGGSGVVQAHTAGKTMQKVVVAGGKLVNVGGRGSETARTRSAALLLLLAAVACVGLRLFARGPRVVSAGVHPDDRHPDVQRTARRSSASNRSSPRRCGRSSSAGASTRSCRRPPGVDAVLNGDIRASASRRSSFTERAAGLALLDHAYGEDRVPRPARRTR